MHLCTYMVPCHRKHQYSRKNKTYCIPRDHTLSVYCRPFRSHVFAFFFFCWTFCPSSFSFSCPLLRCLHCEGLLFKENQCIWKFISVKFMYGASFFSSLFPSLQVQSFVAFCGLLSDYLLIINKPPYTM